MDKTYEVKELEELIGCEIVGVVHSTDGEDWYGLKIDDRIMEQGYLLWFVQDEEGNGPGSFNIENYDTAEEFEEV